MLLIFDCYSGLCNQFYDIQCAVNFCLHFHIPFTFRYACFRTMNVEKFITCDFEQLFDETYFHEFDLYIPWKWLQLDKEDIYNEDGKLLCKDIFEQDNPSSLAIYETLKKLENRAIVLKQFWNCYKFEHQYELVYPRLKPCAKLQSIYETIKKELGLENGKYNFLHYRHEVDFLNHFKITKLENINDLLNQTLFRENDLKIYVATTNLRKLITEEEHYNKIVFKEEDHELIENLNFEERAFVDYLFGLHSIEVCGHSNSSFSHMLNNSKLSCNYYNE